MLLTSLFTVLTVPLSAGEARAEDKTAAKDHWERGTKFYDLGKYDDAIREFEAAYEAKGDPAFLYNLAQSHRLAGHSADALRFYRTYLRYVPKATNRADIELRIKELEKTVAERPGGDSIAPPAAGATPAVGTGTPAGQTAPPATTTWPPPAGATSPGAATSPSPIPMEGQPPMATPMPGTAFPGSPAAEPDPVAHKSKRKTAGIAIGAAGGAVFIVGAIFGAVAKSQGNKVNTAAKNGERFDPSVESLGKTSEALQWVGYGLGAAAIATGIVLFVTARGDAEAPPPPPQVAIAPLAGPGTGGALLRVSF